MADKGRTSTRVTKTASASDMASSKARATRQVVVKASETNSKVPALTSKERQVRAIKKYSTTTFGFGSRTAYSVGADITGSSQGNFYSPQLSTDFLEKPQNLRERRAWYRHFYNANEFVGQAIDLHSTLPISKIKLDKPKCENQDYADYIYDFYVDMCEDMKLTSKTLVEISHEFWLLGNAFLYSEDHDPYRDLQDEDKEVLIEQGRERTKFLYEKFEVVDRDPNYRGVRKLIVLPPDQIRIKKVPLSDDIIVEFIPDPDTKKSLTNMLDGSYAPYDYRLSEHERKKIKYRIPESLANKLKEGGAIPLDTDPYSGSHVYQMARKKCQYETMGVSILERCINTLLLHDKLRQAQTSIASRHMTPIRIVWAEELSETDVDNLREQVDLALVDPDFSIITNFQVNWEEMGSNGRLLELSAEYEHIENSLFAGLGVTREILTGEGMYSGNRISLEILNTLYLLFRESLTDYIENNLFKPVAKKKGFEIEDKFGRKKLIFPKVSFSRLAIRDNDAFFDQAFNMYNKGSLSVDVILDMMNVDPISTRQKLEADLFTVNDSQFTQMMQALYGGLGQILAERWNTDQVVGSYLKLEEKPPDQTEGAEGGLGGIGGGMGRFASTSETQQALAKILTAAKNNPQKLRKIAAYLSKNGTGLS